MIKFNCLLILFVLSVFQHGKGQEEIESGTIFLTDNDITVLVGETVAIDIIYDYNLEQSVQVTLQAKHAGLLSLEPETFQINNTNSLQRIHIQGLKPGITDVISTSVPNLKWISEKLYLHVTVAISETFIHLSIIVGWIYFAAWSVSFYPQIYINFKRKSVVGLNFDFLAYNLIGFTAYALFNIGLYYIPEIQETYFKRNPGGSNPVLLNDVIFALHAVLVTLITIFQCFIYEHGGQKVSKTSTVIILFFAIVVIVSAVLVYTKVIVWLDFLYYLSYIKLSISIIKYIPQAVMNYRRKSTSGWSIGNVLLDFTGGMLSMLQMLFNAYNYDDWASIFGDPTKFGMGLFSVVFDIFFILQHYVFYRHANTSITPTLDTTVNSNAQKLP